MQRILVCDDEAGLREMLSVLLRRRGYDVQTARGVSEAQERIKEADQSFDAVVTDLMMPDGSGTDVLASAIERDSSTQVVVITAYTTTERAVEAMRGGAYDFVEKPFRNDVLLATLEKALEKRNIVGQVNVLRAEVEAGWREGDFIGKSSAMQNVRKMVDRVARSQTSVLITGESGTGKEMVARAIHFNSDRAGESFIVVNCGALPATLMESELFGHEKGAFTGAQTAKKGLFRAADKGTIFLDEVGELPLELQVKLLRTLQEKKVRPVGAADESPIDVRVLAATNRDVERDVDEGKFRADLYYRLNVIRLALPPLRERGEDIRLLAEHFLRKHCALQDRPLHFDASALRWLASQRYPGNARELQNLIERAVTLAEGEQITRDDFPEGEGSSPALLDAPLPESGFDLNAYLQDVEIKLLRRALEQSGGVRTKAAKMLGMSFRSLRYRLKKLELSDENTDEHPID